MKKKKKSFVIRDLITHAYFYAIEASGTAIYYSKEKSAVPKYTEPLVFKVLTALRRRGARVIHEPV